MQMYMIGDSRRPHPSRTASLRGPARSSPYIFSTPPPSRSRALQRVRLRPLQNARSGFTLMEVLVVVAIFSVVTVALVNVFLLSNRAQQKTQSAEVLHATALHIMNRLSADLRRYGLDYGPYTAQSANLSQAVSVLFLQGGSRAYSPAGGGCADAASTPCLQVSQTDPVSGTVTTENMTPKGIQLEQFAVWITPTSDPYTPKAGTGEYSADTPATVTVVLRLRGTGAGASSIRLQQTITMRRYVR